MLTIAMLSCWHVHAPDYAKVILDSGLAAIKTVWDDDVNRGEAFAKSLNCGYQPDLDRVLADPEIDAVICDAPTTQHFSVIQKAALAKKHIFTEKVLAPTTKECRELAKCIEEAGITFTISFPQLTTPAARFAKAMVEQGKFGKISRIRFRNGHDGHSRNWLPPYWFQAADTAGGALMDLGCHPMYLANWFLGEPASISAAITAPSGSRMDDAASVTIEYKDGAVFTGETSFVSYHSPNILEIYGTDATLIAVGDQVRYSSAELEPYTGKEGLVPKLPEKAPLPIRLFLEACVKGTGTPKDLGPRDGVALTYLLENAYLAHEQGKTIDL